jgi:hypothetical protein
MSRQPLSVHETLLQGCLYLDKEHFLSVRFCMEAQVLLFE